MTNEMRDDEEGGMVDDMTGALVPTDPTEAAQGFEALREFLMQVCAEEVCDSTVKRLATLALAFGPEQEALRQRLADADALELHLYLLALHWGRCVLDGALFDLFGNTRLVSMAQALHPRVVSRDALPLLPLLPAAGRNWRAECLGVEALPCGTVQMHKGGRGQARRRRDALRQGQRVLMMLLADRRRGACWELWQRVTVDLLGRYPDRSAWSRAKLWGRSESELQALHRAVEDLRFLMDAALTGLFAVSPRSLRSIRRVLVHWPAAAQLRAEAQRQEPAGVWLSRWVGPAPRRSVRLALSAGPGPGVRRVTLAYARRHWGALIRAVRAGGWVFIKHRRRGVGFGAVLEAAWPAQEAQGEEPNT